MKLVLAFALTAAALAAPLKETAGPPAICFALEVSGKTMPWSEGEFTPVKGQKLSSWHAELLPLLESESALTRMENLRRTAIILSPLGGVADAKERGQARKEMLSALRARALHRLLAAQDDEGRRVAAHACFDLGYLQAALQQIGVPRGDESAQGDAGLGRLELKKAAARLPKDPAIALGTCLGLFEFYSNPEEDPSLRRCLQLLDQDPLVASNAREILGSVLSFERYDELVARDAD